MQTEAFPYSQYCFFITANFPFTQPASQPFGSSCLYHLPSPPPCLFHQFLLSSRTLVPSQIVTALRAFVSQSKPPCEGCSWPAFPKCSLHPKISLGLWLLLTHFSFLSLPFLSTSLIQAWVFWNNCHFSWRYYKKSELITILSRKKKSPFYVLVRREKFVLDSWLQQQDEAEPSKYITIPRKN